MEIDWTPRTLREWRHFFAKTQFANWMQSWGYAQATRKYDYYISRLGMLEKDGAPVGLMCVQEIKLGPIHFINLKRGPLWFSEPNEKILLEFAECFRKEFPKTLFQRMRWMPEMSINESLVPALNQIGFKLRKENFISAFIDLRLPLEIIRLQLKPKWRNGLKKAEKSQIEIFSDSNQSALMLFLKGYSYSKKLKQFQGPSAKFLQTELEEYNKSKDLDLIWAHIDQKTIGAIAIAQNGNTIAYRAGWNLDAGRELNAHYALLWKAIQIGKAKGLKYLDVGGFTDDSKLGVTHFKQGLGGTEFKRVIISNA